MDQKAGEIIKIVWEFLVRRLTEQKGLLVWFQLGLLFVLRPCWRPLNTDGWWRLLLFYLFFFLFSCTPISKKTVFSSLSEKEKVWKETSKTFGPAKQKKMKQTIDDTENLFLFSGRIDGRFFFFEINFSFFLKDYCFFHFLLLLCFSLSLNKKK